MLKFSKRTKSDTSKQIIKSYSLFEWKDQTHGPSILLNKIIPNSAIFSIQNIGFPHVLIDKYHTIF